MIPKKKENLEAKDSYIPINKGHFELDTDQRKKNLKRNFQKVGKMSTISIEVFGHL